jgi:(1->4)-alpha-D-glucan 1-alpha-D-glucosylmutase
VPDLERALASLPVYRTYVEPWSGRVEDADREALAALPEELRRVLLLEDRGHDEFVTRFQQTTGPVMAKGVEDTTFYRYVRMLALNEVGGDPGRFGLSVEAFHRENAQRADRFPGTLLPGTTHDTKRSADVRARIGAIAGMAGEWAEAVARWHELTSGLREGDAPDWPEELLVYQTLAGAWPIEVDRLEGYLEKALREAKRNTSWIDQNAGWERAVKRFATGLLTHEPFLADFAPVQARIAAAGARSSIGQLVLRLTSPGVPDVYNGDELPYFALVDPDNRRPVDWETRRAALASRDAPHGDSAKLHVIREALALRRRRPEAFAEGGYEPLRAGEGTVAYRRGKDVVVAVPVRGDDPELDLPRGRWRNVLEGVENAIGGYRVCLFERR